MAAILPIAIGGPVQAETSKSFGVSATIQAGCAIDGLGMSGNAGSMGTLTFAPQPSVATTTVHASLTGSQAVTLRCSPGVQLSMTINGGLHQASSNRNLQLASTTERLVYSLCADAGCTQAIGINQGVAIGVTTANMNDVHLPIFSSLTLPGDTPPGTYTDTLTITLSW
ncbi:spore coat U domain-containing protein [Sphingobium sp. BYY-5]|uniref:Csu type fimbrial protein n=1 Tax=Sphingobium sp. BYY-5 TaxID=2926400 RepID=UPI001FA6DC1E|nr:spore coat U domain-containing protein [Sphingobium sp. BYY-5]